MTLLDPFARLKLDDNDLESRRSFFALGADDLARLAALRPFAEESGSRRLVDGFEIESEIGRGTTVRMVKWTKF
jgi:hypothetical protein